MIIGTSRPSQKWQIVIPKKLRSKWDIENPRDVEFIFEIKGKQAVHIKPEKKSSWKDLVGSLTGKAKVPYSVLRNKKKVDDLIGAAVGEELLKEL